MTRRKHFEESHDHSTFLMIVDMTILPFYRISKILVSKTPFKESVKETRGHFFFDICCAYLMLFVLGWLGTWKIFGEQWYEMWVVGVILIVVMVLCTYIGRRRRSHRIPKSTLAQRVTNEEQRETEQYEENKQPPRIEFVKAPVFTKVKSSRASKPNTTSNYKDVKSALSNMGYSPTETQEGAKFAEANIPNGSTEEKLKEALRFFNNVVGVN